MKIHVLVSHVLVVVLLVGCAVTPSFDFDREMIRIFREVWTNSDGTFKGGTATEKENKVEAALSAVVLEYAKAGDPAAIRQLAFWHETGNSRMVTRPNRASAIGLYTLAARQGDSEARLALARLGAPVPAVDRKSADDGEAWIRLGLGILQQNQSRLPPQSPTINCETTSYGSRSETSCR